LHREPAQARSRLGVVFQARTLDLDLTVRDNLLYHAALHWIAGREADVRRANPFTVGSSWFVSYFFRRSIGCRSLSWWAAPLFSQSARSSPMTRLEEC
jgi:hypothetical protein